MLDGVASDHITEYSIKLECLEQEMGYLHQSGFYNEWDSEERRKRGGPK